MRTLGLRSVSCLSKVAQVIMGRTETWILEEQVWACPLQGFQVHIRPWEEASQLPSHPLRPTPHLPAIAPYLRVKCSRLGLEGEEELGAK